MSRMTKQKIFWNPWGSFNIMTIEAMNRTGSSQ